MEQKVVLSGYSQRHSASTGHVTDEYLMSVRVAREQWSSIDFDHLQAIDVVETLAQFEMRRAMSKSGVFKAIVPLEAVATSGLSTDLFAPIAFTQPTAQTLDS